MKKTSHVAVDTESLGCLDLVAICGGADLLSLGRRYLEETGDGIAGAFTGNSNRFISGFLRAGTTAEIIRESTRAALIQGFEQGFFSPARVSLSGLRGQ